MASSGFRRKFRRSRFSRPLARKRLIWCTSSQTVTEVAGTATGLVLLNAGQWVSNASSGELESAKVLRLVWSITSAQLATNQTRLFSLSVDDAQQLAFDPSVAGNYAAFEPFHIGQLFSPGTAISPLYNGHLDNMRTFRVNRKLRSDFNLNAYISPSLAGGQLTFTSLARCLVQLE